MDLRNPIGLLGLSLGLLVMSGCKHDPVEPDPTPVVPDTTQTSTTGTLRLQVEPTWGGAPFALNTVYHNVSDYRVKVELLKFYLGNIRLLSGTDTVLVKDVALFNVENGQLTLEGAVAPGNWTGFAAGLGVPMALNDADPVVYGPGHPLSLANATYWSWGSAYRFVMFDGRYDTDPSGTAAPTNGFSMHTGLNALYRNFELSLGSGITTSTGNTTTLTLAMAVDDFFHSPTDTLDLATENQSHGDNGPLAIKLTDNVVRSFSVQ